MDERTPRPRRLTGFDKGRPPDLQGRVLYLEQQQDAHEDAFFRTTGDLREEIARLTDSIDILSEAIRGPANEPHKGLLARVHAHDASRHRLDKVVMACLIALCVGLTGWAVSRIQGTRPDPIELHPSEGH